MLHSRELTQKVPGEIVLMGWAMSLTGIPTKSHKATQLPSQYDIKVYQLCAACMYPRDQNFVPQSKKRGGGDGFLASGAS